MPRAKARRPRAAPRALSKKTGDNEVVEGIPRDIPGGHGVGARQCKRKRADGEHAGKKGHSPPDGQQPGGDGGDDGVDAKEHDQVEGEERHGGGLSAAGPEVGKERLAHARAHAAAHGDALAGYEDNTRGVERGDGGKVDDKALVAAREARGELLHEVGELAVDLKGVAARVDAHHVEVALEVEDLGRPHHAVGALEPKSDGLLVRALEGREGELEGVGNIGTVEWFSRYAA